MPWPKMDSWETRPRETRIQSSSVAKLTKTPINRRKRRWNSIIILRPCTTGAIDDIPQKRLCEFAIELPGAHPEINT